MKEESEKVGLKLNIQKTKIMASSPITSWQIDGKTVADFIFWGSKITVDGDFSSVQSLSHVRLCATPWIAACQASLSITNSWSSLKLMSISQWCHLILCQPLLLLPPIPPSIRVLLSSASLSAIRVVSSAYLRLLIFLPAILIPACASSSPVLTTRS